MMMFCYEVSQFLGGSGGGGNKPPVSSYSGREVSFVAPRFLCL